MARKKRRDDTWKSALEQANELFDDMDDLEHTERTAKLSEEIQEGARRRPGALFRQPERKRSMIAVTIAPATLAGIDELTDLLHISRGRVIDKLWENAEPAVAKMRDEFRAANADRKERNAGRSKDED